MTLEEHQTVNPQTVHHKHVKRAFARFVEHHQKHKEQHEQRIAQLQQQITNTLKQP